MVHSDRPKHAYLNPGIVTTSPSVGQVPMADDDPTGSPTVSVDVLILVGSVICSDEDDKDEDEDPGHVDDDDEDDEIIHETLPKEAVHAHTPSRREHRSTLWKYLRRIDRHDLSEHGMKEHCGTHREEERRTGIHRVQKIQSNRAYHQRRMGSVSSESPSSSLRCRSLLQYLLTLTTLKENRHNQQGLE